MQYRPEIDGLRALAVIPVILFHAGLEMFSGGFLGVDIFFVISGYLITGIIVQESQAGTFSMRGFLLRRARRLLPALYFMFLVIGLFYLLLARPSAQESILLGESLLSSLSFLSNFYFAINTGYFASSSELLPFLHTWSLSVEEQFYIMYPPLLLFFLRPGKKSPLFFLSLSFILSLSLAQFCGPLLGKWNFYILPTRAWEISLGAISYFGSSHLASFRSRRVLRECLSITGLALIIYAIFFLDLSIAPPSGWCLLPGIGTALIILFCTKDTCLHALLRIKFFVFIGIVSYGAYLWHHPILALIRHFAVHPQEIPLVYIWCGIGSSFILAVGSYYYVERWFRSGQLSLRWLFLPLTLIVFIGIFPEKISSLGVKPRSETFSNLARDLARTDYDAIRNKEGYSFGSLDKDTNDILLLGDSHARMLIPNLSKQLVCKSWRGFHPYNKGVNLDSFVSDETSASALFLKLNKLSKKPKAIILSFRNSRSRNNYFYDSIYPEKTDVYFQRLEEVIIKISQVSPLLILVGPVPESGSWGPNLGRNFLPQNTPVFSQVKDFQTIQGPYIEFLNGLQENHSFIHAVFPHEYLMGNNKDMLKVADYIDGKDEPLPLYYDDDHLNSLGSEKLVNAIVELVEKNNRK